MLELPRGYLGAPESWQRPAPVQGCGEACSCVLFGCSCWEPFSLVGLRTSEQRRDLAAESLGFVLAKELAAASGF